MAGLLGFGGQPDVLLAVEQPVQSGRKHTPHLEEPAKFRDLLMNVTASQIASR